MTKLSLRQPLIPTASFAPALRIILAIIAILTGLFFTVGFIAATVTLIVLFFAYNNLLIINFTAGVFSLTTHLGSIAFYLAISVLSFIFAYRLIKKQPLSQKQLVIYILLFVIDIAMPQILSIALRLTSLGVGA